MAERGELTLDELCLELACRARRHCASLERWTHVAPARPEPQKKA
jgi:hypothetical protein